MKGMRKECINAFNPANTGVAGKNVVPVLVTSKRMLYSEIFSEHIIMILKNETELHNSVHNQL